eukprot:TRINITY_DN87803_c0_g1_i1.p1 TRINITY_DN87803_c0_g1~~TRINITY_DN87803_c0_g1_i1.p1  ORF type:complete len:102 (+),score=15.87 TRINITY_DN87803_c0_g1_i1:39-308(+)
MQVFATVNNGESAMQVGSVELPVDDERSQSCTMRCIRHPAAENKQALVLHLAGKVFAIDGDPAVLWSLPLGTTTLGPGDLMASTMRCGA